MKVLLVGYKPDSIEDSRASTQLLAQGIYEGFEKLGVELEYLNYRKFPEELPQGNINRKIPVKLPQVDFVLAIIYAEENNKLTEIKEKTSAKKLVTLREITFKNSDYNFIINPVCNYRRKRQVVPIPCYKQLMGYTTKEPKSILIDHYWESYLGTNWDFTELIESWLEPKKEYTCYRMLRFKNEIDHVKDFETPIPLSPYVQYLKNTQHVENFIVTHHEGFPYGIVDMAVRGTRIFTPPKFIPQVLIDTFNIKIFRCKEELLEQLAQPIDIKEQMKQIDKCISYDDMARLMYDKFEEWS